MAEILLYLKDNTHPDPQEDERGCWKRGYIVSVKPDGGPWARKESIEVWIAQGGTKQDWHGVTAIIKIPDATVADVQHLIQTVNETDGTMLTNRRRAWRSNLDLLPVPIRNTIYKDFIYTTTKAQWDAVQEWVGV